MIKQCPPVAAPPLPKVQVPAGTMESIRPANRLSGSLSKLAVIKPLREAQVMIHLGDKNRPGKTRSLLPCWCWSCTRQTGWKLQEEKPVEKLVVFLHKSNMRNVFENWQARSKSVTADLISRLHQKDLAVTCCLEADLSRLMERLTTCVSTRIPLSLWTGKLPCRTCSGATLQRVVAFGNASASQAQAPRIVKKWNRLILARAAAAAAAAEVNPVQPDAVCSVGTCCANWLLGHHAMCLQMTDDERDSKFLDALLVAFMACQHRALLACQCLCETG